jgi:hypothetical protein
VTKPRSMPSKYAVAAYWNMKCMLCLDFCDNDDHSHYVYDGGSDACNDSCPDLVKCARCNVHLSPSPDKIDKLSEELSDEEWEKIYWGYVSMDRAHILDRAVWERGEVAEPEGGIDGVNNILPLCHTCHKNDPMGKDRKEYAKWLVQERDRQKDAQETLNAVYKSDVIPTRSMLAAIFPYTVDGWKIAGEILEERGWSHG